MSGQLLSPRNARQFVAVAFVAVLTVLVLGACGGSSAPAAHLPEFTEGTVPPSGCPVVRGELVDGLVAELTLNDSGTEFRRGELLSMELSVKNCGDERVRRFYPDSQPYEFIVSDEQRGEVWRWSSNRLFEQIRGIETLAAGETVTYTESWNQAADDSAPVPPGRYEILGIDVGCNRPREECHFGMGLPIEIVP